MSEWILLAVGAVLYTGFVLTTWSYARPRIPLGLVVLALFLPGLFPLLLLYVCLVPPSPPVVVIVPRATMRAAGSRV